MKNALTAMTICAAAFSLFADTAVPTISEGSVTMSQDAGSRLVTVGYTLADAPGIVTVDFLTNSADSTWVSIGASNITHLVGDVNCVVQPGARQLTWRPDKSWPNQKLAAGTIRAAVTAWYTNSPPDYMIIDLTGGPDGELTPASRIRYYTCAEAVPYGVQNDMYKTDYLVMRKCPAAGMTFRMGISTNEFEDASEITAYEEYGNPHYVQFTNDFYMGIYEFTQQQWEHLDSGASRPSWFTNDWQRRPVECVGQTRVRGYVDNASKYKVWPTHGHEVNSTYGNYGYTGLYRLQQLSGLPIDLPTEAQWEFAARAGRSGQLPDGTAKFSRAEAASFGRYPASPDLPDGYSVSAVTQATPPEEGGTAIVGSYAPNAWGLYDMLGNVREECLDAWIANYDSSTTYVDPPGSTTAAKQRVVRGGRWNVAPVSMSDRRTVNSNYNATDSSSKPQNYQGFRVCLTLP